MVPVSLNDFLPGTLDVLILKTLSWGPRHGYAIARWIEERTGGRLEIVDAALYKALHRLEHQGAVAAEWGVSENNRRARYYSLTRKGRARLAAEAEGWRQHAAQVTEILETQ